jgi:hypothetical protein
MVGPYANEGMGQLYIAGGWKWMERKRKEKD